MENTTYQHFNGGLAVILLIVNRMYRKTRWIRNKRK